MILVLLIISGFLFSASLVTEKVFTFLGILTFFIMITDTDKKDK